MYPPIFFFLARSLFFRTCPLSIDPFLTLIFLLLYFFSRSRALFYLTPALLSRAVFNFSSVCGRKYISNLSGVGVNINERSIMNERKPRLDVVNQKRLSLGFVVSKSFRISRDRNMIHPRS